MNIGGKQRDPSYLSCHLGGTIQLRCIGEVSYLSDRTYRFFVIRSNPVRAIREGAELPDDLDHAKGYLSSSPPDYDAADALRKTC